MGDNEKGMESEKGIDGSSSVNNSSSSVNNNNNNNPAPVTFDDLLVILGGFGRYQRWVYLFMFLPTVFSFMHKMAWVFIGAEVDYR